MPLTSGARRPARRSGATCLADDTQGQRTETGVDHKTVLWLGVDLTPEGHSVTMRSSMNIHVDQKTSETLESLVGERVRGRVDHDSYLPYGHRAPISFALKDMQCSSSIRVPPCCRRRGRLDPRHVLRLYNFYMGMVNVLLSCCVLVAAFCAYASCSARTRGSHMC